MSTKAKKASKTAQQVASAQAPAATDDSSVELQRVIEQLDELRRKTMDLEAKRYEMVSPRAGRPYPTREMIVLCNYRLTETPPKEIQFSKSMVQFLNYKQAQANPDLVWGISGTQSLRDADQFAALDAARRNLRIYQTELVYRIPGLSSIDSALDQDSVRRVGFFHYSRAKAQYKEELRQRMHAWLHQMRDPQRAQLVSLDFNDLIKQRPMLIHKLMAEDTFINVVVHPVLLNGGVQLRVATVRKNSAMIERVCTRYHDEISTTL